MTDLIAKAKRELTNAFIKSVRENDGFTPVEADDRLNSASRRVVKTYIETLGSAWGGKINLYGDDKDKPLLWEVNAQTKWPIVYNFGADFVVPVYDDELVRRVQHYNADGIANAAKNLDSLIKRVDELGGAVLGWS